MAKKKSHKPCVIIDDFERLLEIMISEYIQTTTVPSGYVERWPITSGSGDETIRLKLLCQYEKGCPPNFSEFLASANWPGITPDNAFPWWARSRIRYSCSTLTATFVRFLVPHMKKNMIVTKILCPNGNPVALDDMEIYSLRFFPNKTHTIVGRRFGTSRTEHVEALNGLPPHCDHNVLRCRKTGLLVDMALGQFLGTMKLYMFWNEEDYFSQIPGTVLNFKKVAEHHIDEQVERDCSKYRSIASPDSIPDRFIKRVLLSYEQKKEHCSTCKGVGSVRCNLKRCTKCKRTMYCCRECQILDWPTHKKICKETNTKVQEQH